MLTKQLNQQLENIIQGNDTNLQERIGDGYVTFGGPDGIGIRLFGDDVIDISIGEKGETMLGIGGGIAALAFALGVIKVSFSVYKNYINKYGRMCRGYKGTDRINCIKRVKIIALGKRIEALEKAKVKCKISKDPQKCVTKINSQVEKINSKKNIMQASLAKFKEQK
jgi:hypothetical protein